MAEGVHSGISFQSLAPLKLSNFSRSTNMPALVPTGIEILGVAMAEGVHSEKTFQSLSPLQISNFSHKTNMPALVPTGIHLEAGAIHCPPTFCGKRRRPFRDVRKYVRFSNEALLYPSSWAEEEVQRSWYTAEELDAFRKERKETVRQLKRAGFDTNKMASKLCLRGFEAYFSVEMNKATRYARDLVTTVVLCEQQMQRLRGCSDTEAVRQRSRQASEWARENALEFGYTDAKECLFLQHQQRLQDQVSCLGLPYSYDHVSCMLVSSSLQQFKQEQIQSRISLVDNAFVQELEKTLRAVKEILDQA